MHLHDIVAHRHTNLKVQISVRKSISSYILERLATIIGTYEAIFLDIRNLCPLHELNVE